MATYFYNAADSVSVSSTLSSCGDCGAIVDISNQAVHDMWHTEHDTLKKFLEWMRDNHPSMMDGFVESLG